MSEPTRLHYISSKDPDAIVSFVNQLPYKIEIKSGPTVVKGVFYLWYILPDGFKGEPYMGSID